MIKDNVYDCDNPPRCLPEDNGCMEQMWTWEQYCNKPIETEETTGAVVPDPIQEHIPVDTSIILPWYWYWILGFTAGAMLVAGVCFIIRGIFRK